MVINRVGPLSSAKVVGLLYAIIGLVFGAIISLVAAMGTFGHSGGAAGPFFGIAAVVFAPVAYRITGFVMTLIMAALYNALANLVGGVEIDLR